MTTTFTPPFTNVTHNLKPTTFWGSLKAPYPTNAWFTNLVLDNGENPVMPYPYHLKCLTQGVQCCLPQKTPSATYVITSMMNNLSLESVETLNQRFLTYYDLLCATMKWTSSTNANAFMLMPIVRGSPYLTMSYAGLTPRLNTIHAILSVNGQGLGTYTSKKFVVKMNNGQTWVLYANNNITLTVAGTSITSSTPFTGTLRLVCVINDADIAIYDNSSNVVAIGGNVNYTVDDVNSKAVYSLSFNVQSMATGTKDDPADKSILLMCALPHHMAGMTLPTTATVSTYNSIKGVMTVLTGNVWSIKLNLTRTSWNEQRPIDSDKLSLIKSAVVGDSGMTTAAGDSYGFGKEVAKLASVALIADQVGDTVSRDKLVATMKTQMNPWMTGTNSNPLRYDTTWGGVITQNGASSAGADYGMGWYNDHHFHFGYFLRALAVICRYDSTYFTNNKNAILSLVLDIACTDKTNTYFPMTRCSDWYDGHSWASGLTAFGDSKNQESTSESINGYYGLYLLGLALKDAGMADLGRVLLAMEISSVQTYWHVMNPSPIYPATFAQNGMVGVLWSSKVDYATWFGANPEYIYGIQVIPITPMTNELFSDSAWVSNMWPTIKSRTLDRTATSTFGVISQQWQAFILAIQFLVDYNNAWNSTVALTQFDGGNSKSAMLYYGATRTLPSAVSQDPVSALGSTSTDGGSGTGGDTGGSTGGDTGGSGTTTSPTLTDVMTYLTAMNVKLDGLATNLTALMTGANNSATTLNTLSTNMTSAVSVINNNLSAVNSSLTTVNNSLSSLSTSSGSTFKLYIPAGTTVQSVAQ